MSPPPPLTLKWSQHRQWSCKQKSSLHTAHTCARSRRVQGLLPNSPFNLNVFHTPRIERNISTNRPLSYIHPPTTTSNSSISPISITSLSHHRSTAWLRHQTCRATRSPLGSPLPLAVSSNNTRPITTWPRSTLLGLGRNTWKPVVRRVQRALSRDSKRGGAVSQRIRGSGSGCSGGYLSRSS